MVDAAIASPGYEDFVDGRLLRINFLYQIVPGVMEI